MTMSSPLKTTPRSGRSSRSSNSDGCGPVNASVNNSVNTYFISLFRDSSLPQNAQGRILPFECIGMEIPHNDAVKWRILYCFVNYVIEVTTEDLLQQRDKAEQLQEMLRIFQEQCELDECSPDITSLKLFTRLTAKLSSLKIFTSSTIAVSDEEFLVFDEERSCFGLVFSSPEFSFGDDDEDTEATDSPIEPDDIARSIDLTMFSFESADYFKFYESFDSPKELTELSEARDSSTGHSMSIHAPQRAVGEAVVNRIKDVLDSLSDYESLGRILILVPNMNSLLSQTQERIYRFCHDEDLPYDLFQIVKCNHTYKDRVNHFWEQAIKQPNRLFVVVHDEAHWAIDKSQQPDSQSGVADLFLNQPHNRQVQEITNVIRLLVTATPYALQTARSRLPARNEIHWDKVVANNVDTSDSDQLSVKYFGLRELQSNPNCDRLYVDDQFMRNSLGEGALEVRRENMIKICAEAYEVAFVLALKDLITGSENASLFQQLNNENLQQFTTDITRKVVRLFLEATTKDHGKGDMLLIRVVSNNMGKLLTKQLRDIRKKLGLSKRFAILHDRSDLPFKRLLEEDDTESNCIERLKKIGGEQEIKCYSDLEGLPCILILCDKGRMGDTFPASFRYYDLRLRYGSSVKRSYIEQDFGRMFRYCCSLSDLPICILPKTVRAYWPSVENLAPDTKARLLPKRPPLPEPEVGEPLSLRDSRYYREFARPTAKHYDETFRGDPDIRRFLIQGKPQVGKTGAFLYSLLLLYREVAPKIVDCASDEDGNDDDNDNEGYELSSTIDSTDPSQDGERIRCYYDIFPSPDIIRITPFKRPRAGKYGPIVIGNHERHSNTKPLPRKIFQDKSGPLLLSARGMPMRSHSPSRTLEPCPQIFGETLKSKWHVPQALLSLFVLKEEGNHGEKRGILQNFTCICTVNLSYPLIFMPSHARQTVGMLDLRNVMPDTSYTQPEYLQIIVVKSDEFNTYIKYYPDVVICALPTKASELGIGASRDFIKRFATLNMKQNSVSHNSVSKWILMLDDSCLKFAAATITRDPCDVTDGQSSPNHIWKWDYQHRDSRPNFILKQISLRDILNHIFSDKDIAKYALIGMSRWRSSLVKLKNVYKRAHVYSFLLLNLGSTESIHYNPEDRIFEDIRFNESLQKEGKMIVKYCRFILFKKQLKVGGCSEHVRRKDEEEKKNGILLTFRYAGSLIRTDLEIVEYDLSVKVSKEVYESVKSNEITKKLAYTILRHVKQHLTHCQRILFESPEMLAISRYQTQGVVPIVRAQDENDLSVSANIMQRFLNFEATSVPHLLSYVLEITDRSSIKIKSYPKQFALDQSKIEFTKNFLEANAVILHARYEKIRWIGTPGNNRNVEFIFIPIPQGEDADDVLFIIEAFYRRFKDFWDIYFLIGLRWLMFRNKNVYSGSDGQPIQKKAKIAPTSG